MKTIFFSRC